MDTFIVVDAEVTVKRFFEKTVATIRHDHPEPPLTISNWSGGDASIKVRPLSHATSICSQAPWPPP